MGSNMDRFTIKEPLEKVNKTLPKWMKRPVYVEDIKPAKMNDVTMQVLSKTGFESLLPVQHAVIQHGMTKDLYIHTLTGSGKTLAYALLILQLLKDRKIPILRVVIVVPSKDLVYQVFKVLEPFNLNITTAGTSELQKELFSIGSSDIFITTPKRLLQHIENGLDLSHLYSLIVDEADRLFGWDWLDVVYPKLPYENYHHLEVLLGLSEPITQKKHPFRLVLVSATLPCHNLLAKDPVYITNRKDNDFNLPDMHHFVIETTSITKPLHLLSFLRENKKQQILIFTHSVESCIRLTKLLKILIEQQSFNVDPSLIDFINGDLSDQQRKHIYNKFINKTCQILICSDLLARGIDLPVDIVVQYDFATNSKQFLHRCGRTSRAYQKGKSVLLIEEDQLLSAKFLKKIVPGTSWHNTGCKQIKFEILDPTVLEPAIKVLKNSK